MKIAMEYRLTDSSEQVYKKKLRRWEVWKNNVRGRVVELDAIPEEVWPSHHNETNSTAFEFSAYVPRTAQDLNQDDEETEFIKDGFGLPNIHPQTALEPCSVEYLFRQTQSYYSWFFTQPASETDLNYNSIASNVFDNILLGRSNLTSDPRSGFACLNKACTNVQALLRHPHLRMVSNLLSHCSYTEAWKDHNRVRHRLIQYFVMMAQQELGLSHPLSKIGNLLLADDDLREARPRSTKLLLDAAKHNFSSSSGTLLSVQSVTATDYIRMGDYAAAEDLLGRVITQASTRTPPINNIEHIRHARYVLGSVYLYQGKLECAEREWLNVMDMCVKADEDAQHLMDEYHMCYRRLGLLYERQGRLEKSEHFFRQAIKRSIRIFGEEDPATMRCLESLKGILVKQGKDQEVRRLEEEYGMVLESLKGYQLGAGCQLGGEGLLSRL
jgi:tetratricopeptide (TPR) repeat protein